VQRDLNLVVRNEGYAKDEKHECTTSETRMDECVGKMQMPGGSQKEKEIIYEVHYA
jgi:hypothetical protein